MSDFLVFVRLGFGHITDLAAMDHILFLLALSAIYRPRDWRESLWVVSAFTVGHSVTLALAVTDALRLPTAIIEFLIPVTIVLTAVENLVVRDRAVAWWGGRYRSAFAGVFGLVHGAGFANYLRALMPEHVGVPLFGFNVGIELGQIAVLVAAAVALAAVDRLLASLRLPRSAPAPLRLRIIAVSSLVCLVAAHWAFDRRPW